MSIRGKCAVLGLGLGLAFGAAHANLLVNGGFEVPAFPDNPGHFIHTNGAELPGWTTFSTHAGTVLFNTSYDPVTEGQQAIQIEVPGDSVSQSFATIVGAPYLLSFDMSAFTVYGGPGRGGAPCPCASIVDVNVGPASGSFASSSAGYVTWTLGFTAAAATTTLTFTNPADPPGIGNYPHIDNVSVVAVPEPETYGLMIAGLAALWARRRRGGALRSGRGRG